MSKLDFVGALQLNPDSKEQVDPKFAKEGLLKAREKSWKLLHEFRTHLKEGMTEDDARKLALQVFADSGVQKHWHKPYIRFGAGTALTFNDPLQTSYRLKANDPYYIDLGPVWTDSEHQMDYEADVGDTFTFGHNPEAQKLADTARHLFLLGQTEWQSKSLSGKELYQYLEGQAKQYDYTLKEKVEGHRLSDFPHHKYSKERLGQLEFQPSSCLWVLEVQIIARSGKMGAFYEDLLH